MDQAESLPTPRRGALPLGSIVAAMKRDPAKLRILFACTMAAVVTVFEPTYLTLSTSAIQTGLRAQNSMAPMVFAVAFLLLALLTLLAGTAADLFGRRLFLLLGLVGLTVSNVLGLMWLDTPKAFAIADTLNAISGVMVLPAAIAIVTLTFEPSLRPFAYGVLFAIQGTALVVGLLLIPVLGGVWDGRATFIPVLLLGVIACVSVVRHVPESRAPESLRRGTIIVNLVLMAGLFLMIFLVVTASIRSERSLLILAVAVALLVFAAVVRWVARRLRHFKGIEVYGGRDLGLAILAGVMMMFAQGCFFYQITPFFYDVQQVGAVEGALRFVPYVVGLLAGGMLIARLAIRFGARRILALSFVLSGAALLGLSFVRADTPFWLMIVPITVIGLAAGLGGPARTQVVMSAPPEGLVNGSAAVNTAAGQAGYSLGVIVSSVLVTQHADRIFVSGLTAAGVSAETVTRVSSGLQTAWTRLIAAGYPELPDAIKSLTGVSYSDAFTSGMTQAFFLVAIAMFATALVMLVGMRRGLRATLAVPLASDEAKEDGSADGSSALGSKAPGAAGPGSS
jgi:MFS family permease